MELGKTRFFTEANRRSVRYPAFSGTSVPRDFVEFPSQVNEMWSVWPEVLANYAKHYQHRRVAITGGHCPLRDCRSMSTR